MSRITTMAGTAISLCVLWSLCACNDQSSPEGRADNPSSAGTVLFTWASFRATLSRAELDFTVTRQSATQLRILVTKADGAALTYAIDAPSGTQLYDHLDHIHAGALAPDPDPGLPVIGATTLRVVRDPGGSRVETAGILIDDRLWYVHDYVWDQIEAGAPVGSHAN